MYQYEQTPAVKLKLVPGRSIECYVNIHYTPHALLISYIDYITDILVYINFNIYG